MGGSITPEMGSLAIAGILIVFGVLALISLVVALLKKLDGRWQDHERRVDEAAMTREPTIDNTTLVLISAAAAIVALKLARVPPEKVPFIARTRPLMRGTEAPSFSLAVCCRK